MSSDFSWPKLLDMLLEGKNLSGVFSNKLMSAWLKEELSPEQTGAFLAAFRSKGITGEELASMALVLREACSLPCDPPILNMVDTCGTGGDGAETFNISTAVAFSAAACGAFVAKHGNRSASGKVGSADVLESLGINLKAPLEDVVNALTTVKVTFLFAPVWHPSLVNLAPIRKSLGVRTIFNLLGPLVNPLKPQSQVLGVAKYELLKPMAEALQILELKRAVVVHGAGGLDEASLQGVNDLIFLEDGELRKETLDPTSLGLISSSIDSLKGGGVEKNKMILADVLQGRGSLPQRDVVALNTSLVLWAYGIVENLSDGVSMAIDSLNAGKPWTKLMDLKKILSQDNK